MLKEQEARGNPDYSFNVYPDGISDALKGTITIAHGLVQLAAKAECLIYVLNALGENIEY